jgi:hypothetical protein
MAELRAAVRTLARVRSPTAPGQALAWEAAGRAAAGDRAGAVALADRALARLAARGVADPARLAALYAWTPL